VAPICAFLEDVAEAAEEDRGLENLLRVEVGEWLGGSKQGVSHSVAWNENQADLPVCTWIGDSTNSLASRRKQARFHQANLILYDSPAKKITTCQ
jgi:hypothetical protein